MSKQTMDLRLEVRTNYGFKIRNKYQMEILERSSVSFYLNSKDELHLDHR